MQVERKEYKIKKQKIIQCDCLKELEKMNAESIDVIVTSPPYNIGIKYNTYQDNLSQDDYLGWMEKVSKLLHRVLKPAGSFFLNVGSTSVNPNISHDIRTVISKNFKLQNHIIWVKSISIPIDGAVQSFGHFKPINSRRFLNHQHEDIYHWTKDASVSLDRLAIGVPYQHKSNIERWKHDSKEKKIDNRCRGNVWYMPYKTVMSKKQHPAGFPVELPENCIRLHGVKPEMSVLDPFLGAGTTLVACNKLDIYGIGLELDEAYAFMSCDYVERYNSPHTR